jgi:hypothetical protein
MDCHLLTRSKAAVPGLARLKGPLHPEDVPISAVGCGKRHFGRR